MKHFVIPIFIPHKGCPFDCIYCNQKTISGQVEDVTIEGIESTIQAHLDSINQSYGDHTQVEIGFYGGSFTGIEREQQLLYLKTVQKYIQAGQVKGVRLSTRPDYINNEILDYLKHYNVTTIELGVQSLDEEVLAKSCRGHSVKNVYDASSLIKDYEIHLGIQTMIGLPVDTEEKDISTANKVVLLAPSIARIYPTLVIRGTYLENLYFAGKYTPLGVEDAVGICARILELYENNNIKVIRIGLQPTDTINETVDVVAGPFHPAFRQLVESRLALNRTEKALQENNICHERSIKILTGKRNISNVIGQKKHNINILKEKFKFESIQVEEVEGMETRIGVSRIITNK